MDITARPALVRSISWRPLLVAAILVLAIVAGLVALAGSRAPLPPPFGPAGNGLLVYRADDGTIFSVDPTTRTQLTVAPASAGLGDPTPSRDGRRIVFGPPGPDLGQVLVTDIDGSHRVALPGTYRDVGSVDWSPDSTHLAFTSAQRDSVAITVAATDGSGAVTLPLQRDVRDLWYLPDGRLAIIAADTAGQSCDRDLGTGSSGCLLFTVGADGTGLQPIVESSAFEGLDLNPSFDGTKVVYVEWAPPNAPGRLHIVDLMARRDTLVPVSGMPEPYNINHAWFSPDASSILFDSMEVEGDHWAVVPTAGGQPVRIGPRFGDGGSHAVWAPDARSVLAYYGTSNGPGQLWLLDPTGHGGDRQLQLELPGLPAWQRVANR